ncbi:MAG: hypothetical protein HYY06_27130 [Deltaproteobacteria bacterium]|nr:hypothetical protein [Deltaproteobacteria bacterium]
MDLFLSAAGEVLLMVAVALDLRRLRTRGPAGELEPFRLWALRVYFFSVLALPFYMWRTRGRFRWSAVGAALGLTYLMLMSLVMSAAGGCSASTPEGRRGPRDGRASDAPLETAPVGRSLPPTPTLDVAATVSELRSERFPVVRAAEERIVRDGGPEAVAALVEMAREGTRAPLLEAEGVVYPGGRRFHGYGPVIPYDLERLGARAGWALEELTLRDFGFRRAPLPLAEAPVEDPRAAERAAAWWGAQSGRFERVDAVVAAIAGPDGDPVHRDALVAALQRSPLEPQIERALRTRIAPALRDALARARGDHRDALCAAARALWLGELYRDHASLRPVFDRHLAGNANLLEAVTVAMAPEVTVTSDVPGAAEILAPAYASSAVGGLVELVRRVSYANRASTVGLEISDAGDAITLYAGDTGREAASWARLLGAGAR